MNEIRINDTISYIEASDNPLSSDIGIINTKNNIWLYDVGNNPEVIKDLNNHYNIVLSHFHIDHTGNINQVNIKDLYVSKETYKHVNKGNIVLNDLYVDGLHIFPIPSSHSKGSLGLEVGDYVFVGDSLYSKVNEEYYIYNAQLLKEEIQTLKNLKAKYILESHSKGLVKDKDKVIEALEFIYSCRKQNEPLIYMKKAL